MVAIGFAWWDARLMRDQLAFENGYVLSQDMDRASTVQDESFPTKPLSHRSRVLPIISADGFQWIMHAQAMVRRGVWRIRHTDHDNAPDGRAVHWSSAPMWLLLTMACGPRYVEGLDWLEAIEVAAPWMYPVLLIFWSVISGTIMTRWLGGWSAGVFLLGIVFIHSCYQLYRAAYVDHHGLVAFAVWTGVIGAVCASGITEMPFRARFRLMLLSAISFSMGMWINAASVAPVLVGMGCGVLPAMWVGRRLWDENEVSLQPLLWRWWGICGGVGCVLFYLLEYFPDHFDWRLEVNHPLYALAWVSGGELLCSSARWILAPQRFSPRHNWRMVVLCTLGIIITPLALLSFGSRVFKPADPFMWRLHEDYIVEFQSLWFILQNTSFRDVFVRLNVVSVVLLPCLIVLRRGPAWTLPWKPILWLAFSPAVVVLALTMRHFRWIGLSNGLSLIVGCVLIRLLADGVRRREASRGMWGCAVAMLVVVLLPYSTQAIVERVASSAKSPPLDAQQLQLAVVRDVARHLRQANGSRDLTVLTNPTDTTRMVYFGEMRGVGTLYWENLDGLKNAASIFASDSLDWSKEMLMAHGITHLVFFPWEPFVVENSRLHFGLSPEEPIPRGFASSLLFDLQIPPWLRIVTYRIPDELLPAQEQLMLFEVVPDQAMAESYHFLGEHYHHLAETEKALSLFRAALQVDAKFLPAVARLVQTLANLGKEKEAHALAQQLGWSEIPPHEAGMYFRFGLWAKQQQNDRLAIDFFRRSLVSGPPRPDTVMHLARLLVTAADEQQRLPREAEDLIRWQLGRANGGVAELDAWHTLGLALAAQQRFTEAVAALDSALNICAGLEGQPLKAELETTRDDYRRRVCQSNESLPPYHTEVRELDRRDTWDADSTETK